MIKKIFYTILITLTFFLGLNNVSAETNRMYMSFDGGLIEIGNTRSLSSGYKTFTNRITFSDFTTEFDTYSTLYARYAFCSFSDLYSTNSNVVNTNIRCSNNGSIGTLSFFTVSFNEDEIDEATYDSTNKLSTIIYNTSFNIYSSSSDTFTLYGVNIGHSLDDFPSYDSNSDVLDSLDVLNGSLTTILNINRDILYYVMKIYENSITCRPSKNVVDFNNITYSKANGATGSRDNGVFTVNNSSDSTWGSFRFSQDVLKLKPETKYTFSATVVSTTSSTGSRLWVNSSMTGSSEKWSQYGKSGDRIYVSFTTPSVIPDSAIIALYPMNLSTSAVFSELMVSEGSFISYESYGEVCVSTLQEQKQLQEENNVIQKERNDFMNDDDTSGSSSEAQEFFEGFDSDTFGLTSIITAPLELIGNIAGSTCSPLPLQIPFVGGTFNLPCMSSIYKKHFGSFLTVYQTITFGIVAYWVCIRIFALVKDFKNPEHDEIEVMDL